MNRILFLNIILILGSRLCYSQQIPILPLKEDRVIFEFIDSSISLPQKNLYQNAKQWIVRNFKDAKTVIQSESPENGKITLKGNGRVSSKLVLAPIERMDFAMDITCKDNKYRVQIFNVSGYPLSLPSLSITLENLYDKCKGDLSKENISKKERKNLQEQKLRACETVSNIVNYVEGLRKSISAEMKNTDDF